MKTTLDLPDEMLKEAKATAAMRGESLRDFISEAIESRLSRDSRSSRGGEWRTVFGLASPDEVASVDRVVARDLEGIDPAEWQ